MNPADPLRMPEDKRLLSEYYGGESFIPTPVVLDIFMGEERVFAFGYVNPWWPAATNLLDSGGTLSDIIDSVWFLSPYPVSGANGRLGFVGVTRDQYGSPLGNVTVRCYLTSSAELVSTVLSDADGQFTITTPYGGAHYLTTHATGVAGATVDTLTPS